MLVEKEADEGNGGMMELPSWHVSASPYICAALAVGASTKWLGQAFRSAEDFELVDDHGHGHGARPESERLEHASCCDGDGDGHGNSHGHSHGHGHGHGVSASDDAGNGKAKVS